MFTSKIIASFSSVGLKRSNKNIENVVASIVQYNREIDYNRLLEKIEIMSKLTSIFSNKNMKINIGAKYPIGVNIKIDNKYFKVIDISLYSFLDLVVK